MITMEKVGIHVENFRIQENQEESEDKIILEANALPIGVKSRNGVYYDEESIIKTKDKWVGKPVLWNHDELTPAIGHITEADVVESEGSKFLAVKADLDPEEKDIIRKSQRGDIPSVSIQAYVDEVEGEEETVRIVDPLEISPTNIPGFPETTMDIQSYAERLKAKHDDSEQEDKRQGEPFAGFQDWDDCMNQMTTDQGYDQDTAEKVCGMLKDKYETIINDVNEESQDKEDDDNMTEEESKDKDKEDVEKETETEEQEQQEEQEQEQEQEDQEQEQEEQEQVDTLDDALTWLEDNAPDDVTTLIQDAVKTEDEDEDEDDEEDEEEETEEAEDDEEDKEEEALKNTKQGRETTKTPTDINTPVMAIKKAIQEDHGKKII